MNEDIRKKLVEKPTTDTKVLEHTSHNKIMDSVVLSQSESDSTIGYFINFGVTTCRLFEILKDKKGLKERKVISYEISNPKNGKYLKGIIEHVKNEILPEINKNQKQIFLKAFADACFSDVFPSEAKRNKFIMDFYNETSLYFNILYTCFIIFPITYFICRFHSERFGFAASCTGFKVCALIVRREYIV